MKETRRAGRAPTIVWPAILLIALLVGSPALAQCFCLAHPATEQVVHYGCEARPIPNRVSERVTCLDETRTKRATVADSANFRRIPEGEGVWAS
jgi:hypothetical protein